MFSRRTYASLDPEIIDCRAGGWSIPQMILTRSQVITGQCIVLDTRECVIERDICDELLLKERNGIKKSEQVLGEEDNLWTTYHGS